MCSSKGSPACYGEIELLRAQFRHIDLRGSASGRQGVFPLDGRLRWHPRGAGSAMLCMQFLYFYIVQYLVFQERSIGLVDIAERLGN